MNVQYHVAHDGTGHVVYSTTNGINRHYIGPRFDTPRGAIDYAGTLRGMPVTSPLRASRSDGHSYPDGSAVGESRGLSVGDCPTGSPDALVPPATRAG